VLSLIVEISMEEKFRELILKILEAIERNILWLMNTVKVVALHIARGSYFTMMILGIILWATGLNRYMGRRLMIGGSIIALLSEILLS